ncbi:hypothetical protein ASG56_01230 [Rhodococcus sp. Leaf7]|nr:hypothetical protein ASG56_01230 [Rhodococcus sp. Leaf7]KQU41867.1 hypothetical protein ASG64_01230 [Rhodococcus sp. Leaf247]
MRDRFVEVECRDELLQTRDSAGVIVQVDGVPVVRESFFRCLRQLGRCVPVFCHATIVRQPSILVTARFTPASTCVTVRSVTSFMTW